jgi:putative zinc finger protein
MSYRQMMTCDDVDAVLLDYLEETLDPGTRAAVDEHVAGCLRCNAMLRDIGSIRAQAADLPELTPSRDLWADIATRIEPTVVPLVRPQQAPRRTWIPLAAAAAAALMIATAGVTYLATSRSLRPAATVAAVPKSSTTTQQIAAAPSTAEAPAEASPPAVAPTSPGPAGVASSRVAEQSPPRATSRGATLASRRSEMVVSPSDIAYGDEIARLQNIITERRRELDPATVTVIEQSLKIIDAAVRQSRAALARDPKSGFLTDQLNHALDKKIELLRTVALLPSRT